MIDNDFMLSLENALLVPREFTIAIHVFLYPSISDRKCRQTEGNNDLPQQSLFEEIRPNKEKGYPLEPNPGKLCTDVYRLDERDARPIFRGFRGGKRWTKRQLTSGRRNHYYRSLVSDSSLSKRMDSSTPRQYSGRRRRRKGSEQSGGKLIGGGGIPLVPFVRPDDVSSLVFHRTPPLFPRLGPADRKLATVVFRTERRQPRDLRRLPAVQILPRQSSNVFFLSLLFSFFFFFLSFPLLLAFFYFFRPASSVLLIF